MNEAAVMALEQDQKVRGLRGLLAFVGMPSKTTPKDISGSASEILTGIKDIVEGLLLQAIENKTMAEFKATRDEVFSKYFVSVMALSSMAKVVLPPAVIQRLTWESFSEIEADLRDQGLARFGQTARDQAMFTVWTFRKINALATHITAAPTLSGERQELDRKLVRQFSLYSAWSQFHLDCLIVSIRFDKAINPDILDEITDGLRAGVNAYGLIREAVNIREQAEEPLLESYAWDEEDQELVDSSMREIEADL